MRRPLEVEQALDPAPAGLRRAFGRDPGRWLPEPARWHGRGRWNVRLDAGRLSRVVVCRVGPPWQVAGEHWRLVAWEPAPHPGDALPVDRWLPSFTGELGLVERDGRAGLRLRGTYRPPAGLLGAAADAAGLRAVAAATAGGFLGEVARRLGALATAGGAGRGEP